MRTALIIMTIVALWIPPTYLIWNADPRFRTKTLTIDHDTPLTAETALELTKQCMGEDGFHATWPIRVQQGDKTLERFLNRGYWRPDNDVRVRWRVEHSGVAYEVRLRRTSAGITSRVREL